VLSHSFYVLCQQIWCVCQALQLKVSEISRFALFLWSTVHVHGLFQLPLSLFTVLEDLTHLRWKLHKECQNCIWSLELEFLTPTALHDLQYMYLYSTPYMYLYVGLVFWAIFLVTWGRAELRFEITIRSQKTSVYMYMYLND